MVQSGVGNDDNPISGASLRAHYPVLIVMTVIAMAVLVLAPGDVDAAPNPPPIGDWTIGAGETVSHTQASFDLRGDLDVRGVLELDNCTLWVWQDIGGPRELVVRPGGELRLVNTAVASAGIGRSYYLQAEEGSELTMDRSSVWRAGDVLTNDGRSSGVWVATDDAVVTGSQFMECLVGIWVSGTDLDITDCDFVDSRYGAVVDAGGVMVLDEAELIGCAIGALSNASTMTVTGGTVYGCGEGVLAYGGNMTVEGIRAANCSVVALGAYSAEATVRDSRFEDAEADGVIVHESRAWVSGCTFTDLDTDIKVIHSEAWLVGNRHWGTFDEAMWMYHATFHVRDALTSDSYWALKAWKSTGDCYNMTALNATYGAHLERCADVLIDGLTVDQQNRTRRQIARGLYITGSTFTLQNATIQGVRTGIDMLSASGTVRWVRIDDCYQDGIMVTLSWFFSMSDVNVTRADDGYWLNLYSSGRLERCVASLCRSTGFNFSAGATTTLVECNSSANPVGVVVRYASPTLVDCDMFMCDDAWCITNETLGMDLFSGSPTIVGGSLVGGFGGIRLNDTNALVTGVSFTNIERWAVQVRESTGDTIEGCTFVDMINATAVFVWKGQAVIRDNTFYRLNYGITGADDSHLVLEGNTIENVTYDGIWIVANSTAEMRGNLVRDIGYYGLHAMYYTTVTSRNDVIRDVGSYCVFVWKASSFIMTSGSLVNSSVGVYAFDAIDVTLTFCELRDLNRGVISYKDKSANALTFVQHVTTEGCYLTNSSAYAIGVFDVNLTVVDCNFLDNIAAMQVNNATVSIMDSSMVGSWLFGIRSEGTSHVTWEVRNRGRILSSDLYGAIDIKVNGGDLLMDDVLVEPTVNSYLRSTMGAKVVLHGVEYRADGAIVRFRESDVEIHNCTFTAVGPALGGTLGNLGVTVTDGSLDLFRTTFRRTRTGLSLVNAQATIDDAHFSECGEAGLYARGSDVTMVGTRINRTMVGDSIHLDSSDLHAIRSSASIGTNGVVMRNSYALLENCSVGGASGLSLSVNGSTLVLMNTTYQTDKISLSGGGEVEVWWLVTVRVLWPTPEELTSARVWVKDITAEEVGGGRPDAAGIVRWIPVMALVHQDGGDSVHGPHTVGADLFAYTVSVSITLTASGSVLLDLKDLDPPEFQVHGPLESELWISSSTLTVFGRAVDAGSGTDQVRVYTDYNPTSQRTEGEVFSFDVTLSDGRHVVELRATDKAGNAATHTIVVWVETDPLALSPPEPADGTLTSERAVTIKGRLSRVEGVTVRVNRVLADIDDVNRSYSVVMDLLEGENVFSILAEDWYGHETWWNITVTADWTAPVLVITSPLIVNTTDEWVEVVGTVDPDARLFIQGSLVLLKEGSFSVKYPVYVGDSALSVRAEDEIGNYEEVDVFVFRREVSVEPPGADPREVYIFLVIIPIMLVGVYVIMRRMELGGEEA
ncbi:MAG: right-handed parallel beta-helix repeat-containing protein [Thermoplasmata archaeon]|nr:MAG: right-handed parallel beta-helix repeat-containing protein [Thermoplasmata archaeon]